MQFAEGNWTGGAYSDAAGKFSHCAATAPYKSGTSLAVMVDRNLHWSLGIVTSDDPFTAGKRMPLQFRIDDGPWLSATGSAISTFAVTIPMADNSNLIRMFRHGRVLEVAGVRSILGYNLTNTNSLMQDLAHCVLDRLAIEKPRRPR
jgi:hypothetical protein